MNRDTLSTTRKQPKRAENAYVFVTVSCVLRVQCAGSASLIFQLIRYAICRSFIIMILIKFQWGFFALLSRKLFHRLAVARGDYVTFTKN